MTTSSPSTPERARRIRSLILQAVNSAGSQEALAEAIGSSEPTVNRLLNTHLSTLSDVLAQLGLKVVPADHKCVDRATYEFLTRTHARVMERAPELVWDVQE